MLKSIYSALIDRSILIITIVKKIKLRFNIRTKYLTYRLVSK